jgi:hypothetical protein
VIVSVEEVCVFLLDVRFKGLMNGIGNYDAGKGVDVTEG